MENVLVFVFAVTTDVHTPIATVTAHSVSIQCSFILGSQSSGCFVVITSNNSTYSRYVARTPGSDVAEEKIMISEDPLNWMDLFVLVFDWEEDGSIGNLSLPVSIQREEGVFEIVLRYPAQHTFLVFSIR